MQERPEACTFPGQDDDEVVQILIYKHIFSVLPVFVVSIATSIGGLFLLAYAASGASFRIPNDFGATGSSDTFGFPLITLSLIIIVIGVLLGVGALYVWRQNKMLITNENVVDIDQHGIFGRVISTLRLSRVQDVTVQVKGPMQTMFKYGTINIQTAGEKDLFEFDYVPDPYEVKARVQDLFEKFVENKPHEGDGVRHTKTLDEEALVDE
jgi:uncharacterized membrane protein YdbT with pleckstrin-like domain